LGCTRSAVYEDLPRRSGLAAEQSRRRELGTSGEAGDHHFAFTVVEDLDALSGFAAKFADAAAVGRSSYDRSACESGSPTPRITWPSRPRAGQRDEEDDGRSANAIRSKPDAVRRKRLIYGGFEVIVDA